MKENLVRSPEEFRRAYQRFEDTLPPELRLVPLLLAYVVGASLTKKKDDKKPLPPPPTSPVAVKDVKETPFTRTQEIKVEPPKIKEQRDPWEKTIKEKETFKRREIHEVYNLVYYDPEKEEKKLVQVEQPIFYDTLEEKAVDESQALREESPVLKHIADPLISKRDDEIEEHVKQKVEENKKIRGFGKDIETDLLKELDDAVQSTPENLSEAEKRKSEIIKELEEREKLLEQALDLLRNGDEDGFKQLLEKFPPLLKARFEAIMRQNEKLVFQFLLVELHFVKWLKSKIKSLSLKDIEKLAKALASYAIIGALKKVLSKK